MLRGRPGHDGATLLAIDRQAGLLSLSLSTGPAAIDGVALRDQLHQSDYADILVIADDAELARIDAGADILPLARTMERTRNSVLQHRAQFLPWLSSTEARPVGKECVSTCRIR